MSEDVSIGAFDALRCMVNFARGRAFCRLAQAQKHAREEGFSKAEVDDATRLWAQYESDKKKD